MKKYLVGMGLVLSASVAFADSAGLEQFKSMAASVKYTPPSSGLMTSQAIGPMLLRDAIYLYDLPIRAGYRQAQALFGAGCDVFQLVLDVEGGHTGMFYGENGQEYAYPDYIDDEAAMFAYALYSGSFVKGFALFDGVLFEPPPNPDMIVGRATAFGYCFSTNPSAYVVHCDKRAGLCYSSSGDIGGVPSQDLQTTVPWPTYPAFNPEFEFFHFVNDLRQRLGLGLLAQSTMLDTVARNHANYLDSSGTGDEVVSGIEDVQKGYFTGATAQDRCSFAGYTGACPQTGMWSEVSFLMHPSPYLGLLVLTQGARQIGISRHSTFLFTGMTNGPEVQLGYPAGTTPQRQPDNFIVVTQLWGAFHIQVNDGETLSVDTFQVRDSIGNEISGDLVTSSTDPHMRVPAHAAMFVPTPEGVVCDGGVYSVYFSGKRNGTPFTLMRSLTPTPYLYCG